MSTGNYAHMSLCKYVCMSYISVVYSRSIYFSKSANVDAICANLPCVAAAGCPYRDDIAQSAAHKYVSLWCGTLNAISNLHSHSRTEYIRLTNDGVENTTEKHKGAPQVSEHLKMKSLPLFISEFEHICNTLYTCICISVKLSICVRYCCLLVSLSSYFS